MSQSNEDFKFMKLTDAENEELNKLLNSSESTMVDRIRIIKLAERSG